MFAFGKLLNDTPEKVTKAILSLFKVLLTLWLVQKIFDVPFKAHEFKLETLVKSLDLVSVLYYLSCGVAIWVWGWNVIFEMIIWGLVNMISLIIKDEKTFRFYLIIIGVAKYDGKILYKTNPNVRWFAESIEEQNECPFIVKINFTDIFGISLVTYIVLLTTSYIQIFTWQFWCASILLITTLLFAVLQLKWINYYGKNSPMLRATFYQIGKQQLLTEVFELINEINSNYIIKIKKTKIVLTLRADSAEEGYPRHITVHNGFIPDDLKEGQLLTNFERQKDGQKDFMEILAIRVGKYEKPVEFIDAHNIIVSADNIDQMYVRFTSLFDFLRNRELFKPNT